MSWKDLSMADRARYIKVAVDQGITDPSVIADTYDSYESRRKELEKQVSREDKGIRISIPAVDSDFIRKNYTYADSPGRGNNVIAADTIPERKENTRKVTRENIVKRTPVEIEEPDTVVYGKDRVSPGVYFSPDWERPFGPYKINSKGEQYYNLPDIYSVDNEPDSLDKWMLRNIPSFIDVDPRQTFSQMSSVGSVISRIPNPYVRGAGYALMAPDLAVDVYDALYKKDMGSYMSLAGDLAGLYNGTLPVLGLPSLTIPGFNYYMPGPDGSITSHTVPSSRIGGGQIDPNHLLKMLQIYGIVDDFARGLGYDLSESLMNASLTEAESPDTVRIQTKPEVDVSILHHSWDEYRKPENPDTGEGIPDGNINSYGGRVNRFDGTSTETNQMNIAEAMLSRGIPKTVGASAGNTQTGQIQRPEEMGFLRGLYERKINDTPEYDRNTYPSLTTAIMAAYDDGYRNKNIIWDNRLYKATLNSDDYNLYQSYNGAVPDPNKKYQNSFMQAVTNLGYDPSYKVETVSPEELAYARKYKDPNSPALSGSVYSKVYEDPVNYLYQAYRQRQARVLTPLNALDYDMKRDIVMTDLKEKNAEVAGIRMPVHVINAVLDAMGDNASDDDIYTLLAIPMQEYRWGQGERTGQNYLPDEEGYIRSIYNNHGYELDNTAVGELAEAYRRASGVKNHKEVNKAIGRLPLLKKESPEIYKKMVDILREGLPYNYNRWMKGMYDNVNFFHDALTRFKNGTYNSGKRESHTAGVNKFKKLMEQSDILRNYIAEYRKERKNKERKKQEYLRTKRRKKRK